ncbi:MAG: hypothetical protein Kow0025_17980 [Thermodesulfovibrionales bacterium]
MRAATLFIFFSAALASAAHAGVVVHDTVALKGEAVMLRAETRGAFFSSPGQLVQFLVDGKLLGTTLSGGDGVALMEFSPREAGLHKVEAVWGKETDRGLLLCVARGEALVLIDVAGSLMEDVLSRMPRDGSVEALERIASARRVAYVTDAAPARRLLKDWLRDEGYPEAPLLEWAGGRLLDGMASRGVKVRAVVGGEAVAGASARRGVETFSFEKRPGTRLARDWDEIADLLRN